MVGGTKITATLKGDILSGYLDNCCKQRGILLPLLCCPVVDKVIEDLDGNGSVLNWGMCYPHEWKIPKVFHSCYSRL